VWDYVRASGNLFGLADAEGALTPTERQAIVSIAQEIEKKFFSSPQQDHRPWVTPLPTYLRLTDPNDNVPRFQGNGGSL
jgi:hypothetical protein